jgi:hypothetical protein
MAAFVASCCPEGEEVARGYCEVAEQWATEFEHELRCSEQSSSSCNSLKQRQIAQRELKVKIKLCHYLFVVACGCSAAPGTLVLRNLEDFAGKICKHILLVRSQLNIQS